MPELRNMHVAFLAVALLFSLAAVVWNAALFLQVKGGTYPLFVMVSLMVCAVLAYRLARLLRRGEDGQ